MIKRGDVYYADLDPVVGSEQNGHRPIVVIQNDIGNKHSTTTIAAIVTSSQKKNFFSFFPVFFLVYNILSLEKSYSVC